jgi:acyl-CoA thioesterase FadM
MNTIESLITWPESTLSIRFSDCDMYGHLNNIWYLKYLLDAREDHIADSYDLTMAKFASMGSGWVVGTNQIAYLRPALVNEKVIIRSAVMDHTENDILVEMQMIDVKRTHLKAILWSRFVHVGLKDGKRVNIGQSLDELFQKLKVGGYARNEFDKRVADLKSQAAEALQPVV